MTTDSNDLCVNCHQPIGEGYRWPNLTPEQRDLYCKPWGDCRRKRCSETATPDQVYEAACDAVRAWERGNERLPQEQSVTMMALKIAVTNRSKELASHRGGEAKTPASDNSNEVYLHHLAAAKAGERTIMVDGYAPGNETPNNRAVEIGPYPFGDKAACALRTAEAKCRCGRRAIYPACEESPAWCGEQCLARADTWESLAQRRERASDCCPTEELSHFEGCKLFTELRRLRRIEEAASALSDRMRDHWVGGRGGENYWDAPHTAVVALRNALGARPANALPKEAK